MKKICMLILLITCSMGFTGQPIQSQEAPEKFHFYVEVSCQHQTTKNEIESYVKRELRSLGDVEVNKKDYGYTHGLHIQAHWDLFTGKTSISFILVEYIERVQFLRPYLSEKKLEEIKDQIMSAEGLYQIEVPTLIRAKIS